MTDSERNTRNGFVLGVLNEMLDSSTCGEADIDEVYHNINLVVSDLKITYADVMFVADNCMCLGFDPDRNTVFAQ
jgi:hypothetical protein